MPFHISSQRKSPTFHFSWKLFLIDKNICELYKTEKPTTCVVSAPKNCSERSCSHEFQSSKKHIYVLPCGTEPWAMPVRLFWLQMLQKNKSAVDLGLMHWHLEDPPWSLGLGMPECCKSHLLTQGEDLQKTLCATKISFQSFCVVLGAGCSLHCCCRLPLCCWGSRNKEPGS